MGSQAPGAMLTWGWIGTTRWKENTFQPMLTPILTPILTQGKALILNISIKKRLVKILWEDKLRLVEV
jgi:hypothetical protein